MLNPLWYDNSRPGGIAVLETIVKNEEKPWFVPLKHTELEGSIGGPLAEFTLTQIFRFNKDQCPHVIEALYRFPLPGDAAVTGVRVKFGDVTITASLKPRSEAEAEYEEAKKEKRSAALVTRESPDVLTLRVAGIAPDEEVVVQTQYVQVGRPDQIGFSYRIALTTAPRYVREDERYSRHAQGQPLALLADPKHRFRMKVSVSGKGTVTSPTHSLSSPEGEPVMLAEGEVIPDRDCILVWQPPQKQQDVPILQLFVDGTDAPAFLALVTPPAGLHPVTASKRIPRDVVILVDHSGSMSGAKWEAADWAVERFLRGLTPDDSFNLCLFESRTHWFSSVPIPGTSENIDKAVNFLHGKDSGATELGLALEEALGQPRTKESARHVIILTDVEVSDAGRILRLVTSEAERSDGRRCSILCIDAAPNAHLAYEIAKEGRGVARFLTSSPKEEDITTALEEILAEWDSPIAKGVLLMVNRTDLFVDGRQVTQNSEKTCTVDVGDLVLGKSTWVVGKSGAGSDPLSIKLFANRGISSPASVTTSTAVRCLFGARLVMELEYLMHADYEEPELIRRLGMLGYDGKSVLKFGSEKVYAEHRMEDSRKALKDLLIRESLSYGVLSCETGFIAIRQEKGKEVQEVVIVPNALPSGWDEGFLSPNSMPMMPSPSPVVSQSVSQARMPMRSSRMKISRRRSRDSPFLMEENLEADDVILPSTVTAVQQDASSREMKWTVFSGTPVFVKGQAILFDSLQEKKEKLFPDTVQLKRLELVIKDGVTIKGSGLVLHIFVDDIVVPRVRVSLKDLMQNRGSRPLNIRRINGALIRLVLVDPEGEWAAKSPAIEVFLE